MGKSWIEEIDENSKNYDRETKEKAEFEAVGW
jgi:hypothetical protein